MDIMLRREFLQTVGASGAFFMNMPAAMTQNDTIQGEMRFRQLGKTGERVSIIGVGGHHIGQPKDEQTGIRIIRMALDAGVNFLDNCWDYHDGESERRMGKALKDGYRQKAFVMTKIDGRNRKTAAQQLDESLKRLDVDHIDLIQHHEVIRLEDCDRIVAAEGAHEALVAAQKAGKVRFIGFTGHKDPFVHLRMLDVAKAKGIHFDTVQMPLNPLDTHFRSFGQQVLPRLVAEKIGVIGMKSMASGAIVKNKVATPAECLRYALSLPTSTVVVGMNEVQFLTDALEVVKAFQPMTDAEIQALLARTRQVAGEGNIELFKTDWQFDATSKNPAWLGL
jgi:predicted aldo/keto reductase-like oxidoreductase